MNLKELDSYNLADAVKFNNTLNPVVWQGQTMKPEVRERLLTIAEDFKEFLGLSDIEVKDITVSGSNAGYTYTPYSDIDLHLVVDIPQADKSAVYRELFDAKKYQYNDQHNITIGDYDVELYVEDARKQPVSQGIYSVLNNDWVRIPLKQRATVNDEAVKSKFEDVGHRIESAVASQDSAVIAELANKIKNMRQAGLDTHGELSPENLAYKMLRNQGMIKKLYDARTAAQDRELSLNERQKKKKAKKKTRYGYGGYFYPGFGFAGSGEAPADSGGDGGGGESIQESAPTTEDTVTDFVSFCVKKLGIENTPQIRFKRDPVWSKRNRTFGSYNHDTNELTVSLANRHVMDILRTVAHELTHQRQGEVADIPDDAGETGSEYENEANARAGVLMREYGQQHPEFFDPTHTMESTNIVGSVKMFEKGDTVIDSYGLKMLPKGGRVVRQDGYMVTVTDFDTGTTVQLPANMLVPFKPSRDQTQEGVKEKLGALAAAACIAGTPGCATTTAGAVKDIQTVGRTAQTVKNMNRAGVKAELDQELQNFLRAQGQGPGSANAKNQSRLYQLQRQMQQKTPQQPEPQPNIPVREASGYIPTKAQAKDPRFSMALTVDIKPGQVGKEANKLKLKTNRQGAPQIARADGLFETLMTEYRGLDEANIPATTGKFVSPTGSTSSFKAGYDLGVKVVQTPTIAPVSRPDIARTESQKYPQPQEFVAGFKRGTSDVMAYSRNQQQAQQDATRVSKFAKFKSVTPDQIAQIVQRYSNGEGGPEIAPDFGLNAQQIIRILDKQPNRDEIVKLNRQRRLGRKQPQQSLDLDQENLTELALKSTLPVTQTMNHPGKQVYDMKTQSGEYRIVFGISNKDDNFDNDPDYDGPTGYLLDVLLLGQDPKGSWTQYNTNVGEKQVAQIFATIAQLAVKIIKAQPGIDEIEIKGADPQRSRIYSRLMQQNIDSLLPGWKLGGAGLVREKPQQAVAEVIKMPPVNMVFSNENLVDWAYNDAQKKQARQLQSLKTDVPTRVYDMGDHVRVFVIDDQGPVLYLALEKFLDGFKTNAVQIRPRGQGKNLAFKVYQAVSDTFQRPLYSDQTHTDASRLGIWKKLIDKFPNRLVGYDQATREDLPLTATDQGPVVRGKEPIYVQKKKKDLAKPVTPQTRSRTRLLKFLPATAKQVVAEDEQLDEVRMSPSALSKFADSEAAQGIRAGFEAELIFRDTRGDDDDDDQDMEADMDADERAFSIEQVVEFFSNDDWGYGMSERSANRLRDQLDEAYFEWRDEQIIREFDQESEDLVREVWLEERPMNERILSALVDGIGLDDAEADKILAIGDKAPRFTKSSDQTAYKEANPGYDKYLEAVDIAESILDEEVQNSVNKQDGYYDSALEEFRNNYDMGDDSGFFSDQGLRWMSDVMNQYGLDWPYMSGGGSSNYGTRDWDDIGVSLRNATGMPVKVSSNYHSQKRGDYYVVEPDGSLEPDDKSQETGLEIVSPPMPLNQAIEQLQKVIEWANDPNEGNAYTNSSTGLHMGISIPYKGGDVDYLKLILFMGDKYVLDKFGRAANTYTASAMEKLKQNVAGSRNRDDNKITSAVELMKNNLLELAQRYVQQGVGNAKYTSAHIKDGYIEFRSPGGDYLAKANEEINVLEDTMRRFAYAMYLAGRPDLERAEYYKKLYKLIAPEGSKDLELFSKFSAGEITADQLKKQWAEKVIAKEVPSTDKKSNWRLYNRSTDKPVQGLEFSNYTELDAVERAKARVSPASSMTDFNLTYELRDIGTNTGRWNIVQQDTDETLEIVDAATRNEAVDYAHDKYSGGPDNVNFYVIPYTGNQESEPKPKLSRRAELATQIAQPKDYVIVNKHSLLPFYTFRASTMSQAVDFAVTYLQDKNLDVGNFTVQRASNVKQAVDNAVDSRRLQQRVQATDQYEIVDRRSQQVVLRYRADDAADAGDKFSNWLRNQGMPIDTENYGYRPDASEAFERNSDRIDAIRGRASTNPNPTVQDPNQVRMPNYYDPRGIPVWELFDRETGSVLHTIADHTEREAHQEAMAWLRSYGAEDPSTYEERFGVRAKMLQPGERNLGESIDDAQKARNAMDAAAKKLGYANFAAVPQSAKNSVMQLAVNALKLGSGHYNMLDKKNKK